MGAAKNVMEYTFGKSSIVVPARRGIGGRFTSKIIEGVGTAAGKTIGGAGRAAYGAFMGKAPEVVGSTLGVGFKEAQKIGQAALGAAHFTGKAVQNIAFKPHIVNGEVVRNFDNLWTGLKMRKGFGLAITAAGLPIGLAGGMIRSRRQAQIGEVTHDEAPAHRYDGLSSSATGDLTLALHKLRRG